MKSKVKPESDDLYVDIRCYEIVKLNVDSQAGTMKSKFLGNSNKCETSYPMSKGY